MAVSNLVFHFKLFCMFHLVGRGLTGSVMSLVWPCLAKPVVIG